MLPPSGDHIVLELHQRSFFTCIGRSGLSSSAGNREGKFASLPRERSVLFPCSFGDPRRKQEGCLSFCLSPPVTRAPPMWGVMKHLSQKIPEIAFKKSQMYGYLLSLLTSTREEIMRSSRDQFVMFINDCPKTVAGAKGDCVPKFVS
ncbi:hypothetical protein Bca101_051531 [Brassica carinata]